MLLLFNCSNGKDPLDTDVKTKAAGFVMMAIPTKSKSCQYDKGSDESLHITLTNVSCKNYFKFLSTKYRPKLVSLFVAY